MKKILFIQRSFRVVGLSILLFSIVINSQGQNLVPNGDFEGYSSCPDDISQLDTALFWITPTDGTSDYFNQCATNPAVGVPDNQIGSQVAHSGVGYSGIFFFDIFLGVSLEYREYLEVPLTSALVNGECYHFEMYISLANTSAYSVSNIEVYFSDTLISNIQSEAPLPLLPQIINTTGQITDTVNWVLFSGDYIATGGESFLIIGNFKGDANTDTLFVNSNTGFEHYAYYYVDDVSLSLCTGTGINGQNENAGNIIYPSPFNDELTFRSNSNELSEIILYDITSRIVQQQEFSNTVSLNTEQLPKGIYLYEVRNKSGLIKKGKVVKE